MSRLMRCLFAIAFVASSAVGLSCDVNDYCLNCGVNGDGGPGDGGDGDGGDGGGSDADAGEPCVPSGTEVCDDKDNDCDGNTDEGQLPTIGDLCDNQMGECAGGVKICQAGAVKCTKPPMAEVCDNKDNDCDGTPDDGDPGGGAKCGTDMGECVAGVLTCQGGSITCIGAIGGTMPPFGTAESCDGKDNNCDGMIDNGAPVPATACDGNNDTGLCNKGTPTCIGGSVVCVGQVGPSPELCDAFDQDCDGSDTNGFNLQTDPTNCGTCGNACSLMNAVEACVTGQCEIAACETGFHDNNGTASDGCEFGPCTIQGNEVCNNADDDCDGLTDGQDLDMVTPPVATMCRTAGECGGGTTTVVCDGANAGFKCVYADPDVQQTNGVIQQETLCDGKDNDCDGAIDEGQPGLGQACTRGQGECSTSGVLACDPQNLNGAAICDAPAPGTGTTETCDGRDNDCNGVVDDNAALGNLPGQEWVTIPNSAVQMMRYEASRPDANTTSAGALTTHACSRPDTLPWTNITYPQAVAVCSSMGARLCSEAEWQSTCLPDVTYPLAATALTPNIDDFVFVEAENPSANTPIGGRQWVATAPAGLNGVTAMQVPDSGFAQFSAANALTQSARLDYQLALASSTSYTVWLRMRSPAVAVAAPQLGTATAATATLAPVADASTAVGDLVIVTTLTTEVNNPAHALQAGFTQIATQNADEGSNDQRVSVAYRVATAAGAQTYQAYTASGGTSFSGITVLRAGTYDINTLVAQSASDSSNAAPNPPSLGTLAATSVVFAVGGWNFGGNSISNSVSAPSGFTEQFEVGTSQVGDVSVATATFASGQAADPDPFGDNQSPSNTVGITFAIGNSQSRSVWVGLAQGTSPGAANGTFVTTTADNQWQWVASPALTSGAGGGTHTFSVYLREDGVMIDTIAVARQATTSPTFENVWAYETNPRTAQPQVCNGDEVDTAPPVAIAASPTGATASGTTATFTTAVPHRLAVGSTVTVSGVGAAAYNGTWTVLTAPTATTFTATIATSSPPASGGGTANGDQDDMLPTRWSTTCHAEHGAMDVFDMSGNAKEWVLERAPGQNPLRGGSSNNAVNGLTCKLNFTLADSTFFFPNVGFRCCR